MFVGNVCYVTTCYNEGKFQLLLENHLNKRKGSPISHELIEQSIAAYLYCKENQKISKDLSKMESLLNDLGIHYSDNRSYSATNIFGNPEDAILVFNQLAWDFLKEQKCR